MVLQTLAEDDYYDLHNLLTRNAPWNFIIGARGLGKTFAAKRYGIREYLKHNHEFIYLRRTDVEQKRKETFFKDIQNFFPEYEFRIKARKASCTNPRGMRRTGAPAATSSRSPRRAV